MRAITIKSTEEVKKYSVEEYFAYRERNEGRFEFHDGVIRAMAGGTFNHNCIKTDVARELGNKALTQGCEPMDSDMAIHSEAFDSYLLPDISFYCGEAEFFEDDPRKLTNPSLLIEVMSESSALYDRGEKFVKYRSLSSFKEYVLIDSRNYAVECWFKESDKLCRIDSAFDRSASVYIHTLEVDLPLAEIYRRVEF